MIVVVKLWDVWIHMPLDSMMCTSINLRFWLQGPSDERLQLYLGRNGVIYNFVHVHCSGHAA